MPMPSHSREKQKHALLSWDLMASGNFFESHLEVNILPFVETSMFFHHQDVQLQLLCIPLCFQWEVSPDHRLRAATDVQNVISGVLAHSKVQHT